MDLDIIGSITTGQDDHGIQSPYLPIEYTLPATSFPDLRSELRFVSVYEHHNHFLAHCVCSRGSSPRVSAKTHDWHL